MKVNGFIRKEKGLVSKLFLIKVFMRESGNKIKPVGKVKSSIKMEILLKANGHIIKLMDLEYIHIEVVQYTKAFGLIIYKMVMELKFGMMEANLKVNIKMEKSKV